MGNKEDDEESITKAYVFQLFITSTNENGRDSFHSLYGTVNLFWCVEPVICWYHGLDGQDKQEILDSNPSDLVWK